MANLGGQFDATAEGPMRSFDAIPAGTYRVAMVKSGWEITKDQKGKYLACEFEVLDGEFRGRKLWANLNLQNPSVQATEIARRELAAICRACKVLHPNDSAELHDIPIYAEVKLKKRKDTGENQNAFANYHPGDKPPQTGQQPAARPQAPQGGGQPGGAPSWMNRTQAAQPAARQPAAGLFNGADHGAQPASSYDESDVPF